MGKTTAVLITLLFAFSARALAGDDCKKPMPAPLSIEQTISLLDRCKIHSMAELLPLLPVEQRSHFTFVYASHSADKDCASPEHPRAILFTQKALVAFPLDASRPECHHVELLPLDEGGRMHDLVQIDFGPKGSGQKPKVLHGHTRSGQSCTSCHGADPHPNWGAYPIWPGAFGSSDDALDSQKAYDETKLYERFRAAKNPLLSSLVWNNGKLNAYRPKAGDDEAYDLRPNLLLSETVFSWNSQRVFRKLKASPLYDKFKYQVLAALLRSYDDKTETAKNCLDLAVPQAIAEKVDRANAALAESRETQTVEAGKRAFGPGNAHIEAMAKLVNYSRFVHEPNYERLISLASQMHVDPTDWFPNLEEGLAAYHGGENTKVGGIFLAILEDLAKTDPDFRPYLPYLFDAAAPPKGALKSNPQELAFRKTVYEELRNPPSQFILHNKEKNEALCSLLKQHLRLAPAQAEASTACADPLSTQPLSDSNQRLCENLVQKTTISPAENPFVVSCQKCHGADSRQPISFDDPKELSRLREKIVDQLKSRRMPQDRELSDDEIRTLIRFMDDRQRLDFQP